MKTKYLFGMLLGGAMLTACTADDFDTAPVAQEVNPSAPVFVVSFDEDIQNRATWGGTAPSFNEGDKMTLFNGIKSDNTAFDKWQRAIYTGGSESDGAFTFKTYSMVVPGYAVMTYPADESLDNLVTDDDNYGLGSTAPAIAVSAKQTAETKTETPYVSAIINIEKEAASNGTSAAAGYGKTYELVLRRIASTLDLNMTLENKPNNVEGAEEFRIKSVTLDAGERSELFVTSMTINKGTDYSNRKTYKTWIAPSELTANGHSQTVTTTDINEAGTGATFTLLPATELTGTITAPTAAKVVVETNYGTVEFESDKEIWNLKGGDITVTNDALKYLLETLAHQKGASTSKFPDEQVGTRAGANIAIDFKGLKLETMHVKNSDELLSTLAIYDALYEGEELVVYLDGDDENGIFEMTTEALDAMVAHSGKDTKVTFTPCTDEATCSIVNITNNGTAKEIPSMKFGGNVEVQLSGDWKYTDVTVTTGQNANLKSFDKVTSITMLEGNLDLQNNIATASNQLTEGIIISSGVTVNTIGSVTVNVKLYNSGEIYIEAGEKLVAGNEGVIENNPLPQNDDETNTGLTAGAGYISNQGTLATVQGSTGQVNNYGVIEIIGENADTKVTTNGKSSVDLTETYDGENVLGTIILPNGDGNKMTTVGGEQGFIKLHITSNNPSKALIGMANYLVIDNGCSVLTTDDVASSGTADQKAGVPTTVNYIEIGTATSVKFDGTKADYELDALIVPTGKTLYILKDVDVVITKETGVVTVGGEISVTGTLTQDDSGYTVDGSEVNYFGANTGRILYNQ